MWNFELLKKFILRLLLYACAMLVFFAFRQPRWDSLSFLLIAIFGITESVVHTWRYTITGKYSHRKDNVYALTMAGVFILLIIIAYTVAPTWSDLVYSR